ncbi:cytochrome b/b6 domain-containing protein [Streptomyces sp. NPDC059578]|uniref:cytochrome b/b6 domain-containing protein n=1 Tax=Streptomyces sp. NPDC059578 TaxID=3346874 RepID=UPI0036C9F15F
MLAPLPVVVGGEEFRGFVDFAAGVLSLVALTCSVIWGLVASDRVFLNPRQRLLAQAVHRTTAVASVAFLLLHATVKVTLDHTTLLAALVPFSLGTGGTAGLIGLGSLAALLMIATALTGALRSTFASPAPVAARWRAVHALAYPAWCAALLHGLFAGRPAAGWVTFLYGTSLLAVITAIGLRAAPGAVKRNLTDRVLAALCPRPAGPERPPRRDREGSPLPGVEPAARPFAAVRDPYGAGRAGDLPASAPALDRHGVPPLPLTAPSIGGGAHATTGSGLGMAAAYRAVSPEPSGPGRWPIPSPAPPAEAPRPAREPLDVTTPLDVTAPLDVPAPRGAQTSGAPGAPAHPRHAAHPVRPPHPAHPAAEAPPGPFQAAPRSGEPWSSPAAPTAPSGPTGGRQ